MSRRSLPFRIAIFGFHRAMALDIVGPHQILAAVNDERPAKSPAYDIEFVAQKKGPVAMSSSLKIVANHSYRDTSRAHWRGLDTFIVSGGAGTTAAMRDGDLIEAIRNAANKARRIVSVCSGTFLLAEAGLLDGRRATTHWAACAQLKERYPRITVETDPIFVRDGNVWTSAGVTAGMDLALALVEEDFGHEMALKIARRHVLYMIRPGGQSQFSAQLAVQSKTGGRLAKVITWIPEHLDQDLSVKSLASRVAMSERNFARAFRADTGETPARFIEKIRLEAARRLLSGSSLSIETVAASCGFGSAEHMRRSFQRQVLVSPNAYRERFRSSAESYI